ncbi:MAG: C45 family peptidase [Bacteroidales bacterium]|nr:C45 family peptidase [Bacteroidales bacterium]
MKKILFLIMVSSLYAMVNEATACTTFIISGKHTADGRPILYKHRDTGTPDNALVYFTDGKYPYIGLVDATSTGMSMVWGGYNSAGFAIMNSAAYNNNIGDTTKLIDREGIVMKLALQQCATLADFEKMLTELPKPLGVDANFGVIDASGGAAYYETGQYGFKKIDANDPAVAPFGYLIRTNHSFTGVIDKGSGYIRYATAANALNIAAAVNRLDPQYLINSISRNLTHSLTKVNLREGIPADGSQPDFRSFDDFIPRYSTAAVIMVVGAKNGEEPSNTMMWTVLGFPLVTVAVPVWLSAGKDLPRLMSMKDDFHAPLCNAAMKLKSQCFPIVRGSGYKYINLAAVINADNTGILQQIEPVENEIFTRTRELMSRLPESKNRNALIQEHYRWLDDYISESYKTLFGITVE